MARTQRKVKLTREHASFDATLLPDYGETFNLANLQPDVMAMIIEDRERWCWAEDVIRRFSSDQDLIRGYLENLTDLELRADLATRLNKVKNRILKR